MKKENKVRLESLLNKVAAKWDLKVISLNIKTNQNPIILEIIIKIKKIAS